MFGSFIITFRETLEAALIVGLIFSFLSRVKADSFRKYVYLGIGTGIGASLVGAVLFNFLAGGFEGKAGKVFEGLTMLLGAALITTLLIWMRRQKDFSSRLEGKLAVHIEKTQGQEIFLLVFIAIFREGIETVLFLSSAQIYSEGGFLLGALLGISGALVLGYLIFKGTIRLKLKSFFNVTGIMLILFAAGMVAYGWHELQEAGWLPVLKEHWFDINPGKLSDGSFPAWHEKGAIGSVLKGLFGYNGNPSLLEVVAYVSYLFTAFFLWFRNKSEK